MRKLLVVPLVMIAAGAALSLAFPRASFWPMAWVGLVPLLMVVRSAKPVAAAAAGLAFGIGFFAPLLHWIGVFGYTAWALATLLFGALPVCLFAAVAALAYRSRQHWLAFFTVPALWTAVEWLRSLGSLGFPWGYLAYSQAQNLPMVQMTSLTGPWGLTFVIALFNAALASRETKMLKCLAVAVVAAALCAGGYWSMNRETPQREKLAVAVLQGAVDDNPAFTPKQLRGQLVRIYGQLASEAARYKADLVVWPESSVPGDIVSNRHARNWVSSIAKASRAYMIVGGPHYIPAARSRPASEMNGAHMLSPDGAVLGSYYKVHLAPFGEFVPGRDWLPFLKRYGIREADLIPGREHSLLPGEFGKTGVMICFESAFPAIARRETIEGANLLCVITREVLFKKTALALQHHDMAVFRAVENRRFVVRSAESGVSSTIDPCGRVQDRLAMWERGVLYGEVETRQKLTVYSRFGDWFAYLCCLVSVLGAGLNGRNARGPGPARSERPAPRRNARGMIW